MWGWLQEGPYDEPRDEDSGEQLLTKLGVESSKEKSGIWWQSWFFDCFPCGQQLCALK